MQTGAIVRKLLAWLLQAVGWAMVVPLLAIAAARLFSADSRPILAVFNSLTPMLYLPAWPVALLAGVTRRWPLLAAAGVVVVAHLGFALPEVLAAQDLPARARGAPHFRLFSGNVYARNTDFGSYAREIGEAQPDIVLLQEATPAFVRVLDTEHVLDGLPYRMSVDRFDPFGAFIASRWELRDTRVISVWDRPIGLEATVDIAGTAIKLMSIHTVAPTGNGLAEWTADLDHLASRAAAERLPLLLVGDFNATWGHRRYRRIVSKGLTDAAAARGDPFHMTWPRDHGDVAPLVRIDHVLTKGRRLAVTQIHVGTGTGSDHRPLIADVAVLPPA